MNITSTPAADVAKSIEAMGNLLKNAADQAMSLENKLMKVNVIEKVTTPGLGENVDISA
ncbi:MAG TPA: hypothetical protein PK514_08655 [Spirochaetota bacterium]|nr:hypothetical protein [Spirochaetota bacterium]